MVVTESFLNKKERVNMTTPFFAGSDREIFMSKKSDILSVDKLIAAWAARNNAVERVQKYHRLTQDDIAMDTLPQTFSDYLDYDDKMSDDSSWIHRSCFFVEKIAPNFAQAEKEYYAIINLYSSISREMQQSYRKALINAGYPLTLINAVPLMPFEQSEDAYVD
jgi:hypothetical protein